jgi:rhodanese-related sulfurtransferase
MKFFRASHAFHPRTKVMIVLFLGIVIGIACALSVRYIRYSPALPPSLVEVSPQKAYEEIKQHPEKYMLIDVRSEYEYALAHASTSVSMPINTMFDGWPKLPMNKDKEIYLICSSGRLAGVAYYFLEHQGFRNIKRVQGGLQEWKVEGLPLVSKDLLNPATLKAAESLNKGLDIPLH